MTWHQQLVALWDGADQLALFCSSHAKPGGDLYVHTSAKPDGVRHLTAVLPDGTEGQGVHIVRLPAGHRFINVRLASANVASLFITLDESLTPTSETERRLLLLHIASDGEPGIDTLSRASVSRSMISALVADGLKIVLNRGDRSSRTVIWGVSCIERRVLPKGLNSGDVHLTLSPSETAYPEAKQAAPIELEPATLAADSAQDGFGPDPSWPLIVQTILGELDRRPHHGIHVSASRGNPFVQWILRRSAAIHVRQQIKFIETGGARWRASVDRPFGSEELSVIGNSAGNPEEHEVIELTVRAEAPATLAGSLWQLLRNDSGAMDGVRTEQRRNPATGEASADQVTLWFDGAALGDQIGIVSTQPSVLNILPAREVDSEPGNVAMFRIAASGLEPVSLSADDAATLVAEAAKVQERDLGADSRSDQPNRSLDVARRNQERWIAKEFGEALQVSYSGLEPLVVMGLLSFAAEDRSTPLLELYRHDPALCTLLVANGADAARLERVMTRRPPLSELLLRRFADANEAGSAIATEGVTAAAEIGALRILSDHGLRGRLIAARIALDSSTDNLRETADAALAVLADRSSLVPLAQSLKDRGRTAEAQRIAKHLEDFKTGAWMSLAQASQLATEVRVWQAEHAAIENQIEDINFEVAAQASNEGSRGVDDIRKSIDGILESVESRADREASVNTIRENFNLANLDRKQLLQLENRVLTLVYGPARERLVNAILGDLEEWAGLREFLTRLSQPGDDADRLTKKGRREGAVLLINRVETMQVWRVPTAASANDPFTQSRIDLREWIAVRKRTETGSGDQLEQDFQKIVVPIGDLFLHHRAFLALRKLADNAKARLTQDSALRALDRQLARGLVKWPNGAAETWSNATNLAVRIGGDDQDHLGAALVPPGASIQ